MLKRVAVTGASGFVAGHMVAELASSGIEVVGIGRAAISVTPGLSEYICQDLVQAWPAGLQVDAVVHLAGLSAVGPSFDEPQKYINENSAMVTNLCEGVLASDVGTRVLVVSSGAVYDSRRMTPITEDGPIGFGSPYVVSKVLVENLVAYYLGRGLDLVVARPFNHIGPRQGAGFLVPDLWAAAAQTPPGESLFVGDLDTRRDYTDVRDVVRAYRMLLDAPELGDRVFNVCSGRSWSGRELLALLEAAWEWGDVDVQVDNRKLRPDDPREIIGSSDRLRRAVGWRPDIEIPTSIRDFLAGKGGL